MIVFRASYLNEAKRNQSMASGLGLSEVKFNALNTYPKNCDDECR